MPETSYDKLNLTTYPLARVPYNFFSAGVQTAGVKKAGTIVGFVGRVVDVRAYLDTPPTGSTFIIDVNKNGTTIFTTQGNRPTIAIGANASSTTAPDAAAAAVAAGDRLSYDVDQIGSGTAGSDLYLTISVTAAAIKD